MQPIRRIYENSPDWIQIPAELRGSKLEIIILPLDDETGGASSDLDDDERELVANGLMRLPESDELPADFWEMDAPEVSAEHIARVIRAERDED